MNVPNSLTIARIFLAPLLAIAMLPHADASIAALVFAAGMTSDMVDGYLARSRGLVTRFGALMDPIADKLFVGTALICLAATSRLALWVVVVIFARDLLVTGLRFAAKRQGVIIAANALGKAKTVVQAVVVFVLLVAGPQGLLTHALVFAMVAITVVSGAVYVAGYVRGRRGLVLRFEPNRAGRGRTASGTSTGILPAAERPKPAH